MKRRIGKPFVGKMKKGREAKELLQVRHEVQTQLCLLSILE